MYVWVCLVEKLRAAGCQLPANWVRFVKKEHVPIVVESELKNLAVKVT